MHSMFRVSVQISKAVYHKKLLHQVHSVKCLHILSKFYCFLRERSIVLLSCKAFFLGGSNYFTIFHYRSSRIVIKRRYSQYFHKLTKLIFTHRFFIGPGGICSYHGIKGHISCYFFFTYGLKSSSVRPYTSFIKLTEWSSFLFTDIFCRVREYVLYSKIYFLISSQTSLL